jgi:hypothetical protein
MDTAISIQKTELIFQIIKEFHIENNVGIYLLSHNDQAINNSILNFDHIWRLETKDGFSNIANVEN